MWLAVLTFHTCHPWALSTPGEIAQQIRMYCFLIRHSLIFAHLDNFPCRSNLSYIQLHSVSDLLGICLQTLFHYNNWWFRNLIFYPLKGDQRKHSFYIFSSSKNFHFRVLHPYWFLDHSKKVHSWSRNPWVAIVTILN